MFPCYYLEEVPKGSVMLESASQVGKLMYYCSPLLASCMPDLVEAPSVAQRATGRQTHIGFILFTWHKGVTNLP